MARRYGMLNSQTVMKSVKEVNLKSEFVFVVMKYIMNNFNTSE